MEPGFGGLLATTLIARLRQSGIDPARAYVGGGAALHAYLASIGAHPAWTPTDVDVFIEPGARPVVDDMNALHAALSGHDNRVSTCRIFAAIPGFPCVDFLFSGKQRTVLEWAGSFDLSACQVYLNLAAWADGKFMFVGASEADIRRGVMRVPPTLYRRLMTGDPDGDMTAHAFKKERRARKYMERGFAIAPDEAFEHVMSYNDSAEWNSEL